MSRILMMSVLVVCLATWAYADGKYALIRLPLPTDYPQGMTTAIDNQGRITGYYFKDWLTRWQDCHACYWQNGKCYTLPSPPHTPTIAVGESTSAFLIEAYHADGSPYYAYLCSGGFICPVSDIWHRAQHIAANAINKSNQVVGSYETADHHCRAFLWSAGIFLDLGTPDGMESWAYGINDRGQVVGGVMGTDQVRYAFLWQKGIMTILPQPFSEAKAINNLGQIVGYSDCRILNDGRWDYLPCACLWEKDKLTFLGILNRGKDSIATAVNNRGDIVGYSDSGEQADFVCFWNSQGLVDELFALREYPGPAAHASDINDFGQIVGDTAYNSAMYSTWPLPLLWQPQ